MTLKGLGKRRQRRKKSKRRLSLATTHLRHVHRPSDQRRCYGNDRRHGNRRADRPRRNLGYGHGRIAAGRRRSVVAVGHGRPSLLGPWKRQAGDSLLSNSCQQPNQHCVRELFSDWVSLLHHNIIMDKSLELLPQFPPNLFCLFSLNHHIM